MNLQAVPIRHVDCVLSTFPDFLFVDGQDIRDTFGSAVVLLVPSTEELSTIEDCVVQALTAIWSRLFCKYSSQIIKGDSA
jgi:hypothetical protein